MRLRPWVVPVQTPLGEFRKGVLAHSPEEAEAEVRRLQLTTNKLDIAYVPAGEVGTAYERPANLPPPASLTSAARTFIAEITRR
jgi:hypothetical protein